MTKMDELRERVRRSKTDVVAVTETWARENIGDAEMAIEGFNMFRKDRKDRLGGGVVIYVRSGIEATVEPVLTAKGFEDAMWCWVGRGAERMLMGVVYRSRASSE